MIRTAVCDLLDIEHPIALGGMGSATSPALVAAVSKARGLGALGCHYLSPAQINERAAAIRLETNKPFGLNFLTFDTREDSFAAALELRPAVMQFAWARPDQDLKAYSDRAHDAGSKVTYMAGRVSEAARAAWPGAMTRSRRNRFIERWAGREWALRQCRTDAIVRLRAAREAGDVDEGPLSMGQDAGLIHDIPQAADIVSRIALEAEEILTRKLPRLLAGAT